MKSSPNILCPKCGKRKARNHSTFGIVWCKNCSQGENSEVRKIFHRKPLTPQEERKLKWYRNEKKWHEDIM